MHDIFGGLGFEFEVEFFGQAEGGAVADVAVNGEIGGVLVDLTEIVELETRPESLAVFVEDLVGNIVWVAVADGRFEAVERVGVVAEKRPEFIVGHVGIAQVFVVAAQGVLDDIVAEGQVGLEVLLHAADGFKDQQIVE